MARSRIGSRRDTLAIANDSSLLGPEPMLEDLRPLEDRRTAFPAVYRPAKTFTGYARLSMPGAVVKKRTAGRSRFSHVVNFVAPEKVLICVRRWRRREVLFAKKKAGRGGMRKPRRNAFSSISCRR